MNSQNPEEAWLNLQVYKELSKELRIPKQIDNILKRG